MLNTMSIVSRRVPAKSEAGPGEEPWGAFLVWLKFTGGVFAVIEHKGESAIRIATPHGDVLAQANDLVAFDPSGKPRIYREVVK